MVKFTFLGIVRECSVLWKQFFWFPTRINLIAHIKTLSGKLSENDYLVSDLEPNRVTQFNLPVIPRVSWWGPGVSSCRKQPSPRRGLTLTLIGPRSLLIWNTFCSLLLTDFLFLPLLVFHHLFLLSCLFYQPTSIFVVYNLQRIAKLYS